MSTDLDAIDAKILDLIQRDAALSVAEIAEKVGLPLGTVKSHVRRGLMKLHQQLEGVRHESR
jgi:DNA-directed RNA polymerase specialized sigma24 family protein